MGQGWGLSSQARTVHSLEASGQNGLSHAPSPPGESLCEPATPSPRHRENDPFTTSPARPTPWSSSPTETQARLCPARRRGPDDVTDRRVCSPTRWCPGCGVSLDGAAASALQERDLWGETLPHLQLSVCCADAGSCLSQ